MKKYKLIPLNEKEVPVGKEIFVEVESLDRILFSRMDTGKEFPEREVKSLGRLIKQIPNYSRIVLIEEGVKFFKIEEVG